MSIGTAHDPAPRSAHAAVAEKFSQFPAQTFARGSHPGAPALPEDARPGQRRLPRALALEQMSMELDADVQVLRTGQGFSVAHHAATVDAFAEAAAQMVAAVHAQVALEQARAAGAPASELESGVQEALDQVDSWLQVCQAEADKVRSSVERMIEQQVAREHDAADRSLGTGVEAKDTRRQYLARPRATDGGVDVAPTHR